MDPDFILVAGLGLLVLSVPSILSAFSESRPPRISLIVVFLGAGLVAIAMYAHPGGYTIQGMANAFYRVLSTFVG